MAEYIEREKAIAYVEEQYRLFKGKEREQSIVEGCVEALKFTPVADVVPVVRCKNCKRYIKGNAGEQSNYCDCHTISPFEKFFCLPNDYCSCGERKDSND